MIRLVGNPNQPGISMSVDERGPSVKMEKRVVVVQARSGSYFRMDLRQSLRQMTISPRR